MRAPKRARAVGVPGAREDGVRPETAPKMHTRESRRQADIKRQLSRSVGSPELQAFGAEAVLFLR